MTKWSWIMMCIILAGFMEFLRIGIHQTVMYDFQNVYVEKTAPFEYWMQPEGKPRFHTTVCRDYYEPALSTGMTLNRIIFLDQGSCWSLDPNKHAGYWIKRGQDGRPQITETTN